MVHQILPFACPAATSLAAAAEAAGVAVVLWAAGAGHHRACSPKVAAAAAAAEEAPLPVRHHGRHFRLMQEHVQAGNFAHLCSAGHLLDTDMTSVECSAATESMASRTSVRVLSHAITCCLGSCGRVASSLPQCASSAPSPGRWAERASSERRPKRQPASQSS